MQTIRIDSVTQEERDDSVACGFPYRTDVADLAAEPRRTYPWHWHPEVEFFFVQRGELAYDIPGETVVFAEGEAGFVNAGVMHRTRALGNGPCLQLEHIFLPELLSGGAQSSIDRTYIYPLSANKGIRLVRFERHSPACTQAVHLMEQAAAQFAQKAFGYELRIRSLAAELWLLTLELCRQRGLPLSRETPDAVRIQKMAGFIEAHFAEHLTLSQIAAAGNVGERECCRCFSRQLQMSPMDYLLEVRVQIARTLLLTGSDTVERIAGRCGFSSGSYFGKVFRRRTGQSPRECRRSAEATGDAPAGGALTPQ